MQFSILYDNNPKEYKTNKIIYPIILKKFDIIKIKNVNRNEICIKKEIKYY